MDTPEPGVRRVGGQVFRVAEHDAELVGLPADLLARREGSEPEGPVPLAYFEPVAFAVPERGLMGEVVEVLAEVVCNAVVDSHDL